MNRLTKDALLCLFLELVLHLSRKEEVLLHMYLVTEHTATAGCLHFLMSFYRSIDYS